MSEVTDLIDAYRAGDLTLDQLAQRFRERTWPARRPSPRTAREAWQREMEDPEPIQEGSFEEIASAYRVGEISVEDYRVLSAAVRDARAAQSVADGPEAE